MKQGMGTGAESSGLLGSPALARALWPEAWKNACFTKAYMWPCWTEMSCAADYAQGWATRSRTGQRIFVTWPTAALLARLCHVGLCACITPLADQRRLCREIIGANYYEVFVHCPLDVCRNRDVKGLYAKVDAGLVAQYTGVSSPFAPPQAPDVTLHTHDQSVEDCLDILVDFINSRILA